MVIASDILVIQYLCSRTLNEILWEFDQKHKWYFSLLVVVEPKLTICLLGLKLPGYTAVRWNLLALEKSRSSESLQIKIKFCLEITALVDQHFRGYLSKIESVLRVSTAPRGAVYCVSVLTSDMLNPTHPPQNIVFPSLLSANGPQIVWRYQPRRTVNLQSRDFFLAEINFSSFLHTVR
jgi:hypothetical protein